MNKELSVVVMTFEGYAHLWAGFMEAYHDNCGRYLSKYRHYFGTDSDTFGRSVYPFWETIVSCQGEWTDRLKRIIEQIDSEYILLMQEDHWAFGAPDIDHIFSLAKQNNYLRLQISPINRYYNLYFCAPHPLATYMVFSTDSKYLVSHQPSIWRRDFLLECLVPGETPWENEYRGTLRLNRRPDIAGRIAIYPTDWYDHVCVKGVFKPPLGKKI